jgi:hypothetical protein
MFILRTIQRPLMRGSISCAARTVLLVAAAMTATACGGPTGPSAAIAPPAGTVAVFIAVQRHTGSFTLTLGGQTISTDGDHRFNVPAGAQQVTGQLTRGVPLPNDSPGFVSIGLHGLGGEDTGQRAPARAMLMAYRTGRFRPGSSNWLSAQASGTTFAH